MKKVLFSLALLMTNGVIAFDERGIIVPSTIDFAVISEKKNSVIASSQLCVINSHDNKPVTPKVEAIITYQDGSSVIETFKGKSIAPGDYAVLPLIPRENPTFNLITEINITAIGCDEFTRILTNEEAEHRIVTFTDKEVIFGRDVVPSEGIYEYSCSFDKPFIGTFFKEHSYWLLGGGYTIENFPFDSMLDNMASSPEDPSTNGTLEVKTYRIHGKPVGFIGYYSEELYDGKFFNNEGRISFLGIDKEYRSRGLARKLINYALADLKRKGAHFVHLYVNTDNTPARKLYESLGFKEDYWITSAYINYKREV